MSKNMDALVAGVKTNKTDSRAKDYARASEWPKCQHAGCPEQATIKAESVSCTYHYREHGHNASCITEAVKELHPHLKKYRQMIKWNVKQWKENKYAMMGWPVLPATEQEMDWPNKYLYRFKVWIDKSIKEKAEEHYRNG